MVFKHEKFQLDQEDQIVFDQAGNELRIFGNEYLMLQELCKKPSSSAKDLAVMLGLGEFYKGGALDKYVDRLNSHLQGQVVKKEDGQYQIAGEIVEADRVEKAQVQEETLAETGEDGKAEEKFRISWQMILAIGIGIIIGIWLLKIMLGDGF